MKISVLSIKLKKNVREVEQNFRIHDARIRRCHLSDRFFREAKSLSPFQSDEIRANKFEQNRSRQIAPCNLGVLDAIYLTDSLGKLGPCPHFKAMRYEPANLNRIVADKSHRVTLASSITDDDFSEFLSIFTSFHNYNSALIYPRTELDLQTQRD